MPTTQKCSNHGVKKEIECKWIRSPRYFQTIKTLLDEALPTDLARSLSRDIESKVQELLKTLSLVPKHEFENLEDTRYEPRNKGSSFGATIG